MKKLHIFGILITAVFLSGCQTTNQLRKVSVEEAFSNIRALEVQAKESSKSRPEGDPLFTQPVNKSEPCKLPTTQGQLDRKNFRAYWDGECKGGFAFGLGRDIAVSDTHHVEEIITYGDNGRGSGAPTVLYDFVHKVVTYTLADEKRRALIYEYVERITNEAGNFNINYNISGYDGNGLQTLITWSAFNPVSVYLKGSKGVVYRFEHHSIATSNDAPVELLQTFKPNSDQGPIGYTIARFANGLVRHIKNGKGELVELPDEYISMMVDKYDEVKLTSRRALEVRKKAKQMEREYLHLACNDKHEISGLEKEVYNKICTWREQFKEPFELAQKKYNDWQDKTLERMRAEARTQLEQQRLQLEHQRLQEQQKRQAWDAFNRGLQSFNNSMDSIIQNTPKTTNTDCYKRWDGSVNCSSTTY
jgi:hypothetical protein